MTGLGGASGEEHQFEFVGAGTVLLQSSEALMAEQATGVTPQQAGVPGGGAQGVPEGRSGVPGLPGQLGDLQRRFGL
jgi:hypothetical protein